MSFARVIASFSFFAFEVDVWPRQLHPEAVYMRERARASMAFAVRCFHFGEIGAAANVIAIPSDAGLATPRVNTHATCLLKKPPARR
jgi:hypothetical protein